MTMPNYKMFTGNYIHMLKWAKLPECFAAYSEDGQETIQKDIPRTPLFNFKKNLSKFCSVWNARDAQHIYSQGDMTSHLFSKLIVDYYCMKTNRESWLSEGNFSSLNFAYFDDSDVPCGFSITYAKAYPTVWSCAIIRNTTAEPQDREVSVFCHNDLLDAQGTKKFTAPNVLSNILKEIKSAEVEDVLSSLLFDQGEVNKESISTLHEQIGTVLSNKSTELFNILRQHLLAKPTNDDLCLWLALFIRDHKNNVSKMNQLSLEDLEGLKMNPESSEWLNEYKEYRAQAGQLDEIKYIAHSQDEIPTSYTEISVPSNIKAEKQKIADYLSRKNIIRAIMIALVVASVIASVFFPPTIVIACLVASLVPVFYQWRENSKSISHHQKVLKNIETAHHNHLAGEVAAANNLVQIFENQVNKIYSSLTKPPEDIFTRTPSVSSASSNQDTLKLDEEDNSSGCLSYPK